MVDYNNYSLRNLPSVHYGRINVANRHFAHAEATRDNFYRTVPPYSSSVFRCGVPVCGFPMYPMGGFCMRPFFNYMGGFMLGSAIGGAIRATVGLVRSLFSRS